MNTNNQRTVQQLLDREWIVAVEEEIAANPMGIAFSVEPEIMGQYCAEVGLPCEPYIWGYKRLGDVEAFQRAYLDTAALWAATVQAENDKLDAERAWLDGALMELIDGREDEEFWRRGDF
jgi:hypothetical protein